MFTLKQKRSKTSIPSSNDTIKIKIRTKLLVLAAYLQYRFNKISKRKKWYWFLSFWLLFSCISAYHILSAFDNSRNKSFSVTPVTIPSVIKPNPDTLHKHNKSQ
jgi:hypothetical protein